MNDGHEQSVFFSDGLPKDSDESEESDDADGQKRILGFFGIVGFLGIPNRPMKITSPILARQQKNRSSKLREGTVVSFTTVMHPPAGFGRLPRTIGLVALDDGSKVLAAVRGAVAIGARVQPRMALSQVNDEGLRIYDIVYEVVAPKAVKKDDFPGYVLALSGPVGVGKSTVSELLVRMVDDYAEKVPLLTTLPRGSDAEGEYRHVSVKKFQEYMERNLMASFAHIGEAEGKQWYGYKLSDIEAVWRKGKIPVVATEMHLLESLAKRLGRRSILSFGLLPPGKSRRAMVSHLLRRLRNKGKQTEELLRQQMARAEEELRFLRERADMFDRIFVNDELQSLDSFLDASMTVIRSGGRLVVITFHSLEDRIVKQKFRSPCVAGRVLTKKVVVAAREELSRNPRARSAKLRRWEKN